MTTILETKDLSKTYGEVKAVDHVTLAVGEGALFGLLAQRVGQDHDDQDADGPDPADRWLGNGARP